MVTVCDEAQKEQGCTLDEGKSSCRCTMHSDGDALARKQEGCVTYTQYWIVFKHTHGCEALRLQLLLAAQVAAAAAYARR